MNSTQNIRQTHMHLLPSNLRRRCFRSFLLPLSTIAILGILTVSRSASAGPLRLPTSQKKAVSNPTKTLPTKQDLAKVAKEDAERLARVQESVDALLAQNPPAEVPDSLTEELELLKWIELLHSNFAAAVERREELQVEHSQLEEEIHSLRTSGMEGVRPYSFLFLDEVRDQLIAEQERKKSLQLEIDATQAAFEAAHVRSEEGAAARRLAKESLDTEDSSKLRAKLVAEYALARLTSRVYDTGRQLRQLEVEIRKLELDLNQRQIDCLNEKIAHVRESVHFSEEDLNARIQRIDTIERNAKQQTKKLGDELAQAERNWLRAKHHSESNASLDETNGELEATHDFIRGLLQEQLSLAKRTMGQAVIARIVWRRRFAVATGVADKVEIAEWQDQIESVTEDLGRFKQLIKIRVDERLGDLATFGKRMSEETNEAVLALLQQRIDAVEQSIEGYRSYLVMLRVEDRLVGRFVEELNEVAEPHSAMQWLRQAALWLTTAWNYELTYVDERPITVSKVVRGLVLLAVGLLVARMCSRFLGNRVLVRIGLEQGASAAFQSLSFYMMLTCFGFVALEVINLPLTVFAFMGGAIAIGVGFGSQNILNNFISGLILLAERPVRVGDLVEIQGLQGTIEHIGPRSTRVKTGSNLEMIVPNSQFLESNVTNWTLSDTRIRTVVSVGVGYDSPPQEVVRLLRESALENPHVLKKPDPIILFKDFGDNALVFEAHFWIHMRSLMDGEKVASEFRLTVEERFGNAGIVVAYPQRDIHLDTASPIEVNLRQPLRVGPTADQLSDAA